MKRPYLNVLLMFALVMASISTFTSCKDYTNGISSLQDQIDKAALATDVQTLRAQVQTALANDSATAVVAKNAVDAAATNAGNITNLNNDLSKLEGNISANSKATAKRIDSLASAGTITDSEILKLQAANKAAADSAASALAKNRELSAELAKAVKEWTEAKADYYTAEEIDNYLYIISAYFEDVDSRINDTNTNIDDLKKRITNYKVVVDALYTAVTEVTLVTGKGTAFSNDMTFGYGTITKDLTFGEAEKDDASTANTYSATPTKSYKNGDPLIFPKEILVRVNPVNATITPSMMKLVNSKGATLDSLIEIAKVEKYDEYLYKESESTKTRASIATGLWKVTLQLKTDIDVDKLFDQDTKTGEDNKSVLFAVAINNTASQAEATADAADRYVVSDYELTVNKTSEAFKAATDPNKTTSGGTVTNTGITIKGTDLSECKEYQSSTESSQYIQTNNGEEIEISFDGEAVKDKIEYFYVAFDKKNGGSIEQSAYTFEGLNKVVAVNYGTGKAYVKVTIPDGASKNELNVPLRIFAVNYNGEYYNEHGNPFTLHVVKDKKQASVAADMNFTGYEKMESNWSPITASLQDATEEATPKIASKKTIVVTDSLGHDVTLNVEYAKDDKGSKAENDSDIKYVKFSISGSSISKWFDGGEAKGTISNGISSLQVSLTKKMPTAKTILSLAPYTWNNGQLVDGVYTAYMSPYSKIINNSTSLNPNWKVNAYQAYVKMSDAISNLTDKYTIVVHNMEKNSTTGEYTDPLYVGKSGDTFNWLLYTNNLACVDNKTKHTSEIVYDCGKISSKGDESYKVTVENFQTILACPLDESVQTYNWTKLKTSTGELDVNYLKYGDNRASRSDPATYSPWTIMGGGGYALQHVTSVVSKPASGETWSVLNYIKASNSSGRSGFDLALNSLLAGDNAKYLTVSKVRLISNDSQEEYYFSTYYNFANSEKQTYIYFQRVRYGASDAPAQNVPSTLVFDLKDAFGHTHTIKMPFTVTRY